MSIIKVAILPFGAPSPKGHFASDLVKKTLSSIPLASSKTSISASINPLQKLKDDALKAIKK